MIEEEKRMTVEEAWQAKIDLELRTIIKIRALARKTGTQITSIDLVSQEILTIEGNKTVSYDAVKIRMEV